MLLPFEKVLTISGGLKTHHMTPPPHKTKKPYISVKLGIVGYYGKVGVSTNYRAFCLLVG
jgi:hypothetical protein